MVAARDLIQDALEKIGVYASGETITSADMTRGLSRLNQMMDSWSNENLACYARLTQSGTLVPGQSAYTIGPGGQFNMTRPLEIIDNSGAIYVQDAQGNNFPVQQITQEAWGEISNRSSVVQSNYPDTLFYDPQFPLGIINLYPQPNMANTLFWISELQLTEFPLLTTTLSLPPGYELAIVSNLAVAMKPYFTTAQLSPDVMEEARDSKAWVTRKNVRNRTVVYDREIISKSPGVYNIYSDSWTR